MRSQVKDSCKCCYRCKALGRESTKPVTEFNSDKSRADRLNAVCKLCVGERSIIYRTNNRDAISIRNKKYTSKNIERVRSVIADHHRRYVFGVDSVTFDKMKSDQNYVCAICGKPEKTTYKGKTRELAIDHDHNNGKIRGLLCYRCNTGIGFLFDDPNLLEKAVKYLRQGGFVKYEMDSNSNCSIELRPGTELAS